MQLERTGIVISPNNRRVVLRSFNPPGDNQKLRIIAKCLEGHDLNLYRLEVEELTMRVLA